MIKLNWQRFPGSVDARRVAVTTFATYVVTAAKSRSWSACVTGITGLAILGRGLETVHEAVKLCHDHATEQARQTPAERAAVAKRYAAAARRADRTSQRERAAADIKRFRAVAIEAQRELEQAVMAGEALGLSRKELGY